MVGAPRPHVKLNPLPTADLPNAGCTRRLASLPPDAALVSYLLPAIASVLVLLACAVYWRELRLRRRTQLLAEIFDLAHAREQAAP
jgi:hypothetical protein